MVKGWGLAKTKTYPLPLPQTKQAILISFAYLLDYLDKYNHTLKYKLYRLESQTYHTQAID
jgi:hypothetical protein